MSLLDGSLSRPRFSPARAIAAAAIFSVLSQACDSGNELGRSEDAAPLPQVEDAGTIVVAPDAGAVEVDAGGAEPDAGTSGAPCADKAAAFEALAADFERALMMSGVPGGAIAVLCGGEQVFARGIGIADLATNAPVTSTTRFQLASVTKMFTARTAVALAADGVVALDAPITAHVDFVNTQAPYMRPFTFEELLSHSAGYPIEFFSGNYDHLENLETFFRDNANEQLWSPPGAVFNYSNLGFALAGLALQRASGQPFADLVESRVFVPAGMTGARMRAAAVEMEGNYAVGHEGDVTTKILPTDSYLASEYYLPMGGAWASVEDLAAFGRSLLGGGAGSMSTPRTRADWPGVEYGLGLMIDHLGNHERWGHDGSVAGFLSSVTIIPDEGFGVFAVVNGDWYFPQEIVEAAVDNFTDYEFTSTEDFGPRDTDWPDYVGTYRDEVSLGTIIVRTGANGLEAELVDVGYTTALTGVWRDGYELEFRPWQTSVVAGFWRESGAVKYFVSPMGVAAKLP